MKVHLHPHAQHRLAERGVTEAEVTETIVAGDPSPAKFGRTGFRKNFGFGQEWRGKFYTTKQVTAFAVREADSWLVITVIARYF